MTTEVNETGILNEVSTSVAGREFVIRRVINAPREIVYDAWTNPKHLAKWFGPHRFTNPVCEIDARVGGVFRVVMRSPDGIDYPIKGTFIEVVRPAKLVYVEDWSEHGQDFQDMIKKASGLDNPGHEAVNTITFDDYNGKTLLTVKSVFDSEEVCNAFAATGMEEGWAASFERLDGLAITNASDNEIVITRLLDAPQHLVFKAFTDPQHIGEWWGPRGFKNTIHSMDVRSGGEWRFIMHGPDGTDYDNVIVYNEIDAPNRIVYTQGTPGNEAQWTSWITLRDFDGKTQVTLRMSFPDKATRDEKIEKVGAIQGGNQTIDRLDDYLFNKFSIRIISDTEIEFNRGFNAPRELVFEAMSRAEHFPNWWGPRSMTMVECEMDSRPGGKYHFTLRDKNGNDSRWKGEVKEVVSPERIVFTESFDLPGMGWTPESLVTSTLEDYWGRTKFKARVKYTSIEMRDGHMNSGMEAGASETYERLDELVAQMLSSREK